MKNISLKMKNIYYKIKNLILGGNKMNYDFPNIEVADIEKKINLK